MSQIIGYFSPPALPSSTVAKDAAARLRPNPRGTGNTAPGQGSGIVKSSSSKLCRTVTLYRCFSPFTHTASRGLSYTIRYRGLLILGNGASAQKLMVAQALSRSVYRFFMIMNPASQIKQHFSWRPSSVPSSFGPTSSRSLPPQRDTVAEHSYDLPARFIVIIAGPVSPRSHLWWYRIPILPQAHRWECPAQAFHSPHIPASWNLKPRWDSGNGDTPETPASSTARRCVPSRRQTRGDPRFIAGHQLRKLVSVKLQEFFPGLLNPLPRPPGSRKYPSGSLLFSSPQDKCSGTGDPTSQSGKNKCLFSARLTHGVHMFPDRILPPVFSFTTLRSLYCVSKAPPRHGAWRSRPHTARPLFKQLRPCGGIIF